MSDAPNNPKQKTKLNIPWRDNQAAFIPAMDGEPLKNDEEIFLFIDSCNVVNKFLRKLTGLKS